jgi:hypothetical protein
MAFKAWRGVSSPGNSIYRPTPPDRVMKGHRDSSRQRSQSISFLYCL